MPSDCNADSCIDSAVDHSHNSLEYEMREIGKSDWCSWSMSTPALILGSQLSCIFSCLYSLFSLKIAPSVFESKIGSNLSCPFSILTQASTFAFPILLFSLRTAFFYRHSQFSKPSTLFLLLCYFILLSFSILSTA